jgi:hypothetical protein
VDVVVTVVLVVELDMIVENDVLVVEVPVILVDVY